VLLSAATLSGALAAPAAADVSPVTPSVCTQDGMAAILSLGYDVWGTPLDRCTFRLFLAEQDGLAWTKDEWFHGGVFFEVYPETVQEYGWNLAGVKSYYKQIKQRLFWGPAASPTNGPPPPMQELTLKRGPVVRVTPAKSQAWEYPVGTYLQETYYDFPPQQPGLYRWRYTYDDALVWGRSTTVGTIRISG
jgi:hypothetical protein